MKSISIRYKISVIIYILTLAICTYFNYQSNNYYGLQMIIVSIFLPFLIPLIFNLFKWKMTEKIKLTNIVFIYFASVIGSCANGYSVSYFDKIIHFFSGLLATTLAMIIFSKTKHIKKIKNKEDYRIYLIFINAFNMLVASIWEFYEYLMLVFFNNDCINHFTSGVHDCMTDMMCAFVGGLLITFGIIQYYKKDKSNFFIQLVEEMDDD